MHRLTGMGGDISLGITAGLGTFSLLSGAGMYMSHERKWQLRERLIDRIHKKMKQITDEEYLNNVFKNLYFKELSGGDEFLTSMWGRISKSTKHMLQTVGLEDCSTVGKNGRNNM